VQARPGKAKPSHKALGRAIATARDEKGLTQAALAKKAKLHPTYLSGVENGSRNPTWTVQSQIAQSLGLKLSELVARAEAL
jgi:transcriptional regulator with XRE-family HTH domain